MIEHGAWDEVGHVRSGCKHRAHLRRGHLREKPFGLTGHGEPGALQGNDARQLLDPFESLPLRPLGGEIGAEDERPFPTRVRELEVLEQVDGAALSAQRRFDPGHTADQASAISSLQPRDRAVDVDQSLPV